MIKSLPNSNINAIELIDRIDGKIDKWWDGESLFDKALEMDAAGKSLKTHSSKSTFCFNPFTVFKDTC